jgi:hypothetical protein
VVLAVGGREYQTGPDSLGYPVDELASRYGAGVASETNDPEIAYARFGDREPIAYPAGSLPEEKPGS